VRRPPTSSPGFDELDATCRSVQKKPLLELVPAERAQPLAGEAVPEQRHEVVQLRASSDSAM
jgi:hypothetical protein